MSSTSHASINANDIIDVVLRHEIMCRAYELYGRQHETADVHDLKDALHSELLRVAYAASELQKYEKSEVDDGMMNLPHLANIVQRSLGSVAR